MRQSFTSSRWQRFLDRVLLGPPASAAVRPYVPPRVTGYPFSRPTRGLGRGRW
jgi:hypothetical protein